MRDQLIVLAANLGVVAVQATVVILIRVVDAANPRRTDRPRSRHIERAYLASRNASRKRGEQSGGRNAWTDHANHPTLSGNATRWSAAVPGVK